MSSDNVDRVVPPVVIALRLPAPFDPVEISFSTFEVAKPTIESDHTTTTFDRDWHTTIFRETMKTIESTLARHGILTDNEHFAKLQEVLEYPYISQNKFVWYFQFSVQRMSYFIEIDHRQILELFTTLYSGKLPNHALVLHLKLVGAACRHLRNAFSLKPRTTTLVDCNTESTPPNSQRIVTLVPSVVEACSDVTPLSTDHPALSEFGPPVNLVTYSTSNFPSIDEASLPSSTVVSTKTFGSAVSTIFDPGDEVERSAVRISPTLSQPSILVLSLLSTRASHRDTPVLDHHDISKGVGINDDQARLFSDSCRVTYNFDGDYFTEALSCWFTLRRHPPDLLLFRILSLQTATHVHYFPHFLTASHFLGHLVPSLFRDLTASASLLFAELPKPPDIGFNAGVSDVFPATTAAYFFHLLMLLHAASTWDAILPIYDLLFSSFPHDNMILVFPTTESQPWLIVEYAASRHLNSMLRFARSKFILADSTWTSTIISKFVNPFLSAFLAFVPFLFVISAIVGILSHAHDNLKIFKYDFVLRLRLLGDVHRAGEGCQCLIPSSGVSALLSVVPKNTKAGEGFFVPFMV
jgi:hypothetical protein